MIGVNLLKEDSRVNFDELYKFLCTKCGHSEVGPKKKWHDTVK